MRLQPAIWVRPWTFRVRRFGGRCPHACRAWLLPSLFGLLVLLFGLIAIGPLLQPGYFWGAHDARHDVYFLFQYDKSVLEGNWFPRWGPDWAFGYGYPFWIIYAPLGVLLGELCHHFLGLDWETSVKTVFAFSIVLSGLGMYGFARSWLGRRAALLAALAYMLVPYHLVDVYVRAALPESLALALLPLILWGFRSTVVRPRLMSVLAASLAYAALWWTHNLTALIFTPVLMVYVLALAWWETKASTNSERINELVLPQPEFTPEEQTDSRSDATTPLRRTPPLRAFVLRLLPPLAAGLLAFGLSAAFVVPAVLEARNVNQTQWFGSYYNPFQHFVYFFQLFNPAWGYGISVPGPDDVSQGALSYQLGAVPALLALITLFTARRLGRARRELWLFGFFACAAVFLTLNISAPAWHLPLVPYAQFPWRYLLVAIPFLSLLAGAIVADAPADARADAPAGAPEAEAGGQAGLDWPVVVLAGVLLLGSYPYLQVQMREPTVEQGPVSYAALMRFQRTSNEMTGVTAWVDPNKIPIWSSMADEWVAGRPVKTKVDYSRVPQNTTLAVNEEGLRTNSEEVWYHAGQDGESITFNRFWYPGWKAYLLDSRHGKIVREIPVTREDGPLARLVVPLPKGENFLLVRFEDTPLRAAAKWFTIATVVLVLGLIIGLIAGGIGLARLGGEPISIRFAQSTSPADVTATPLLPAPGSARLAR